MSKNSRKLHKIKQRLLIKKILRREKEKEEIYRQKMCHKVWKRAGWKDTHHILPQCLGLNDNPSNKIRLDRERHNALHYVFGYKTFRQIVVYLLRLWQDDVRLRKDEWNAYKFLFGRKDYLQVAQLFKRAIRIQERKDYVQRRYTKTSPNISH